MVRLTLSLLTLIGCHAASLQIVSDTAAPSADGDGDGYTIAGGDCDDTTATVHPDAVETCDGVDDDCNGLVDDADPGVTGQPTWYRDLDGDGYGDPTHASQLACDNPSDADAAWVTDDADCDDFDPLVNPTLEWYADSDGDGYGDANSTIASCTQPAGYVADDTDCDDANAEVWPGEPDYHSSDRGDGSFDYDCDGSEAPEYPALSVCAYVSTGTAGWYFPDGWAASSVAKCGITADYYEADLWDYSSESGCQFFQKEALISRTQLCK